GQYVSLPGSVYNIPAFHLEIQAVLTNTVPIGVTRGPGFAEMIDVMERLIDKAAQVTPFDRWTLRRQNFVVAAAMPWTNPSQTTVDSGDFLACFERAVARSGASTFAQRQRESESRGRRRGLGLAYHIKGTGGSPEENVEFSFTDDALVFTTGTQAIGQGHETSFRQIASTLFGLSPDEIVYRAGDTDLIPTGGGHGSSRATYMASTAMSRAAHKILLKARPIAAEMLDATVEDVEFSEGFYRARQHNRAVGLLEVARQARALKQPLDTYEHFVRDAMTYPNGCHVAEVEVDPQTGATTLLRYTAVDDYGTIVNPMIAHGQVHGAIAQGIGQALMEHAHYDDATGQLVAGSFMDYSLPRADDLPAFDVELLNTPCTTNPLGVKGCGEAGAIAGFPAIANAIVNALEGDGVTSFSGPATPYRVWSALRDAKVQVNKREL
nr:molybdopterin-dependent oxidoreductase [Gammaproteobacteria bacterium]